MKRLVPRERRRPRKLKTCAPVAILFIGLTAWLPAALIGALAQATPQELTVSASFTEKPVAPDERIELRLNRPLQQGEGRLAVLIGQADLTSLFAAVEGGLRYNAETLPLPEGEADVTVYLVSPAGEWKEVARFKLRVSKEPPAEPPVSQAQPSDNNAGKQRTDGAAPAQPPEEKPAEPAEAKPEGETQQAEAKPEAGTQQPEAQQQDAQQADAPAEAQATKRFGFDKLDLVPSLTLNIKSQPAEKSFPEANRPPRPTFTDLTMQASLKTEMARGIFNAQHQFDFVGSSFQQEALRFGELGDNAPQVDLASYLMQFQSGKVKYAVGHTSYGTLRHLMTHSSRGVTLTFPISPRYDFSVAAMKGSTIVGFGNFFGLNKRRHQLVGGTLGIEFLPKRPGGMRLEAGALSAWLQPVAGFNQGVVNDAERSRGVGLRLVASDPAQRFRLDGGFTRSQFTSPTDPLLNQGNNVVEFPTVTRSARYVDAAYDLLKDFALGKRGEQQEGQPGPKKINLTLNFKHEQVDPLYRSLGASTQADKINNEILLTGSMGEITGQFSHARSNDNLAGIPSILQSFIRRNAMNLALPLTAIIGDPAKPSPLLPRVAYTFDRTHNFADAIPVNGGFEADLSAIPDQFATNQGFTANWQIKQFRVDYRFNRSFQDNRQPGAEVADVINMVNGVTFGTSLLNNQMDLTFDLNAESAKDRQAGTINRTLRLAPTVNWRMSPTMTFAANFSGTLAGDVADTRIQRDAQFDLQFTRTFAVEKSRFRKVQGQFFIRYANVYAFTRDNLFGLNTLTKSQVLNLSLSFTFF
ncbi:MAG TPA: hypothetical protein VNO70_08620 [Blastocatellia bacterium]|nr:hypothetical protein [Blastocatellia bacterium]